MSKGYVEEVRPGATFTSVEESLEAQGDKDTVFVELSVNMYLCINSFSNSKN